MVKLINTSKETEKRKKLYNNLKSIIKEEIEDSNLKIHVPDPDYHIITDPEGEEVMHISALLDIIYLEKNNFMNLATKIASHYEKISGDEVKICYHK